MTFVIEIFQFHFKSDTKQVQSNKMKQNIYNSDNIFLFL